MTAELPDRGPLAPLGAGPGLVFRPAAPARIVVLLHGAGADASQGIDLLAGHAEAFGLLLVAPSSQGATWDLLQGGFGPDLAVIEGALDELAHEVEAPVAIGGFSDGASYALSVGLRSGDVFDSVVAFSPGFLAPDRLVGRPRVFLSHGTQDPVLPIERCGRPVARALEEGGYDLTVREFDGGHVVPDELRSAAAAWLRG